MSAGVGARGAPIEVILLVLERVAINTLNPLSCGVRAPRAVSGTRARPTVPCAHECSVWRCAFSTALAPKWQRATTAFHFAPADRRPRLRPNPSTTAAKAVSSAGYHAYHLAEAPSRTGPKQQPQPYRVAWAPSCSALHTRRPIAPHTWPHRALPGHLGHDEEVAVVVYVVGIRRCLLDLSLIHI